MTTLADLDLSNLNFNLKDVSYDYQNPMSSMQNLSYSPSYNSGSNMPDFSMLQEAFKMGQMENVTGTGDMGWFGQGGYLQTGAQGLQALGGLAQAYLGFEGLGLAKDQFKFNKNLATTNLNNQIATIRSNIADRERTKLLANGVSNADVVAQQKAMDYTKDFRGI